MKIKPALAEFKKMAQLGNLLPVYHEFLADTETPVAAYLKLKDDSYSYLLESAENGKRWGRYSFIGCKPFIKAVSRNGNMEVWQEGKLKVFKDVDNPLEILRDLSGKFKPVTVEIFGGKFDPPNFKMPYKLIPALKQMGEGDIRNWEQIRRWAQQLPPLLK